MDEFSWFCFPKSIQTRRVKFQPLWPWAGSYEGCWDKGRDSRFQQDADPESEMVIAEHWFCFLRTILFDVTFEQVLLKPQNPPEYELYIGSLGSSSLRRSIYC